jgi:hypothetical protein
MYYPFFLSELYIDSGWEQIPVLKATDQKVNITGKVNSYRGECH